MKAKFPIILKIGLLGFLVTGIVSGISLTVAYFNHKKMAETSLIESIDKTLLSVNYDYSDNNPDYKQLIDGFIDVKDYIGRVYNDLEGYEIHDKTVDDFASFEEYETYFKNANVWVYPPSVPISSLEFLQFRSNYRVLSSLVDEAKLTSGATAAYVCYKEVDGDDSRFIYLYDSRMFETEYKGGFYNLPSSHYSIKSSDHIIGGPEDKYYTYEINGTLTRFVPINSESITIGYFFIEYDLNSVKASSKAFLLEQLLFLSIVMVATVVVYMGIAYLFITRNLNKLTKITNNISSKLKNKQTITPTKLEFRSHDEVASLSESFNVMEEEIINYVDIIKQDAKENERRAAELEVASNIQLSALPNKKYEDSDLDLLAYIKPAKIVGGDFYDYFYNKDEFISIIADVSGKGVPAALFMMKAKALIKSKILSGLSLVDALKEANNELCSNNIDSLFVTAFVSVINFKKNELRYVNAGHEKPYIISKNKVTKLDGTSNFVLGGVEDIEYSEEKTIFNKGDTLFLFTDGLNESINKNEEEFGYDRVVNILKESKGKTNEEIVNNMNSKLKEFVGRSEQFDDITLLAINYKDSDSLHLSYSKKDYSIIEEAVDAFNNHYSSIKADTKAHVGVVLDELLNNFISYEKRKDLTIDIDFFHKEKELKVVITTNGDDYNPFINHKEKKAHIDDSIGGYGVSLVKNFTKKQEYKYSNNQSIITLIF